MQSWVESANDGQTDFPIQNLPYGVFEQDGSRHIGVAIGDHILDLTAATRVGLLNALAPVIQDACRQTSLNALMAAGSHHWSALREQIVELLRADSKFVKQVEPCLVSRKGAQMRLPACVGDYTDFFASLHHATNAGRLFRPDNPLAPNYKYLPVGYHGRASSLVISGTPVRRPHGQRKQKNESQPAFGPTNALDYELEVGLFVGPGNEPGSVIGIDEAESNIFGLCLLNDWSARDIQFWESQPLGPFLAKSFATSISPWIVPLAALEHFRVPAFQRAEGDPAPLPYLQSETNQSAGGIDVKLEVLFRSARMRESAAEPARLCQSSLRDLYWTAAQLITHHSSNGCNLRPGDLIGSGTVSGTAQEAMGCLLERTHGGTDPIHLPNGEQRTYLEDGDEVTLRGYCERKGFPRIGFGECSGVVTSAAQSK